MENRKVATLTVLRKEEPFQVQQENIKAAGVLGSLIKTCIGPKSMMKMILTRNGSMEVTNDGNSILREIEVNHPVIKSLIELSKTQSEEVGDGTTSVVILASEILINLQDLLKQKMHPIRICSSLKRALTVCLSSLKKNSQNLSSIKKEGNKQKIEQKLIQESISTKISSLILPLHHIAWSAYELIKKNQKPEIKRHIRIEKVPGGVPEDSHLINGIAIQKELIDQNMKKYITNPSILLIDFPLEYRKGENQANIEMTHPETFKRALAVEEEQIEKITQFLIDTKPSLIISEKGISDISSSLLKRNGISAVRRVKKSDLQRIALATGAQIISSPKEISSRAKGAAGTFAVERIGDEFWMKLSNCTAPGACTILLRGGSKDILNELERNLQDALSTARNLSILPEIVPGGGAIEAAMATALTAAINSPDASPEDKKVFPAVANALYAIPSLILINSGSNKVRNTLLELKREHEKGTSPGINGITGEIEPNPIRESLLVKEQLIKSAIEGAIIVLRVDGIVKCA
ncbi:T-complex protein 1 subunit gamma [Nematocida sp. LUAm3]|nr:T-complex protein 1 subunit gamma [Nematocida sp. LUAm3]KAI5175890.1 T-complex protein 1 subunit gamma [Nematocida sp. LUAm2]KAI5178728.1 T-complex protein 1 subunit gamma [Nematocida sp. LUAm1]